MSWIASSSLVLRGVRHLGHTQIEHQMLSFQGCFASLEELDVSGCDVSLGGMKALGGALQQGSMPTLKVSRLLAPLYGEGFLHGSILSTQHHNAANATAM